MKDILSQLQTSNSPTHKTEYLYFHIHRERQYSFRLGMWAKRLNSFSESICASLSVFYVPAILYLQSLLLSHLLSFTSALNNLSRNATPGAVLNLLLLAESPCNINKLRKTMD